MIILITYKERVGRNSFIKMVSHGIDSNTSNTIILQNETLGSYISDGAYWNERLNEWVINS